MHSLVFHRDPKAAIFGRPGKDGGQDARSGDGRTVYQAKFSKEESFAKAIASAKAEFEKIRKYRTPGHPRYSQWLGVTDWVLVTNAPTNPTDNANWSEVGSLFSGLQLEAIYWDQTTLNSQLDEAKNIDRVYFEGESRVLLSLPEAREWLIDQQRFLRREELPEFVGRESEVQEIQDFLRSDQTYLLLHGSGGTGKSRLMLEAATKAMEEPIQVFWANVASMAQSSNWFRAIIAERQTVLLVDEPTDHKTLQVLIEQIVTRTRRSWKAIVTVRSPKDPILKVFTDPRNESQAKWIALEPLSYDVAGELARKLLASGSLAKRGDQFVDQAADSLAKRFDGFPVWIELAVALLERTGSLETIPKSSSELAEQYIDEILQEQSRFEPGLLRKMMRWVALLSPLNRENENHLALVTEESLLKDTDLTLELLTHLQKRKAVTARGAHNRLIEVKPDVLRDHVLKRWLTVEDTPDTSRSSKVTRKLCARVVNSLKEPFFPPIESAILTVVARLNFTLSLSGSAPDLMEEFFTGLKYDLENVKEAHFRIRCLEALAGIAPYCAHQTLDVCQVVRSSPSEPSTFDLHIMTQVRDHTHVLGVLASCLIGAARAALPDLQREIIEELLRLRTDELKENSTSVQVSKIFITLLAGGESVFFPYDSIVADVLVEALGEGCQPSLAVLELCQAALTCDRAGSGWRGLDVTWWTRWVIPDSYGWTQRESVRSCLHSLLELAKVSLETRVHAWSALSVGQASLRRAESYSGREVATVSEILLEELNWTRKILEARSLSLAELIAAREVWIWHYHYDDDESLNTVAEELEQLFRRNPSAARFAPLFDERNETEMQKVLIQEILDDVLKNDNIAELHNFVREIEDYVHLKGQDTFSTSIRIALEIGERALTSSVIQEFVLDSIERDEFSLVVLQKMTRGWICGLRKTSAKQSAIKIQDLLEASTSNELRAGLLQEVCSYELSDDEITLLRNAMETFRVLGRLPIFLGLLGGSVRVNFSEVRRGASAALALMLPDEIGLGVSRLTDAVAQALWRQEGSELPEGLGPWILDLISGVNDWDELQSKTFYLKNILDKIGGVSLESLCKILEERAETIGDTRIQGLQGMNFRLSKFMTTGFVAPEYQIRLLQLACHPVSTFGAIDFLRDVDRAGNWLPDLLVEQIAQASSSKKKRAMGSYASVYPINSEPWRKIARALLLEAKKLGRTDRVYCYGELTEKSYSTSGTAGQVAPYYQQQVTVTIDNLEQETEPCFLPFWQWRLDVAEQTLQRQEQLAKEKRGE